MALPNSPTGIVSSVLPVAGAGVGVTTPSIPAASPLIPAASPLIPAASPLILAASPPIVPILPEPQPQSYADLDKLIKIWARAWAADNSPTRNKDEYAWHEYTEAGLSARLTSCVHHSKLVGKGHHLAFKNTESADVTIIENIPPVERTETINDAKGWKLVYSNKSNTNHTSTYIDEVTEVSQQTITWTASATVNIGVEFGAGIPLIAATKATASSALALSFAKQTLESTTSKTALSQTITAEPRKITYAAIVMRETEAKTRIDCNMYLIGDVVVCCKNKVRPKSIDVVSRPGLHYKWAIPIFRVFKDLESYLSGRLLNDEDKAYVTKALPCFTRDDENVRFKLIGELINVQVKQSRIDIRTEDLPDLAPLPVEGSGTSQGTTVLVMGGVFAENGATANDSNFSETVSAEDMIRMTDATKDRTETVKAIYARVARGSGTVVNYTHVSPKALEALAGNSVAATLIANHLAGTSTVASASASIPGGPTPGK